MVMAEPVTNPASGRARYATRRATSVFFERKCLDRCKTKYARIDHCDIERSELLNSLGDSSADRARVGTVGLDGNSMAADTLDRRLPDQAAIHRSTQHRSHPWRGARR